MKKEKRITFRLTERELEKVKEEIESNEELNNYSEFFELAMKEYFNREKYENDKKLNKKINYIDEMTAINILIGSDVVASQLGFNEKDRREYIQDKKKELEEILRFDRRLY